MRTIFSNDQIIALKRNSNVFECGKRSVHYTAEFKKRALELYIQGISPKEIWKQAGFNISWWKKRYCDDTIKDWRRLVKNGGIESLSRHGGIPYDHGAKSKKDKFKRLELEVKYLKAENDFLAKLRAKRAESNSGQMKNSRSSEI